MAASARVAREREAPLPAETQTAIAVWCAIFFLLGTGSAAWVFFSFAYQGHVYDLVWTTVWVALLPALIAGIVGGCHWRRHAIIWATVYAWPTLLASVTCLLPLHPLLEYRIAFVGTGASMALAGLLGAWLGRRFRRSRFV